MSDIGSAIALILKALEDYDLKSRQLLRAIRLHDRITSVVGDEIFTLCTYPDEIYDDIFRLVAWRNYDTYALLQDMQQDRKAAIDAFDNGYCPAVYNASAKFPTLAPPPNPLTAVGDGSGNGNGQSGSSYDGNGYSTGSYGTGSGFGAGATLQTTGANPSSTNNSSSNTGTPSGDSPSATDLLNQAQQGVQALSTAAQSAAGAAKDAAQIPNPDQQPTDPAAMDAAAADTALGSRLGAAAEGEAGALAATASNAGRTASTLSGPMSSKLFPRANVGATAAKEAEAVAEETTATRAGAAASTGTPGMPGAAARGAGAAQDKSHRQRENLISGQHLDDALGEPVIVGIPIVENR